MWRKSVLYVPVLLVGIVIGLGLMYIYQSNLQSVKPGSNVEVSINPTIEPVLARANGIQSENSNPESYITYVRRIPLDKEQSNYSQYVTVMTSLGQDYQVLSKGDNELTTITWSADGKYIAISSGTDITIHNMTEPLYYRKTPFFGGHQSPSFLDSLHEMSLSSDCGSIRQMDWKPGENYISVICWILTNGNPSVTYKLCSVRFDLSEEHTADKIECNEIKALFGKNVIQILGVRWSPDGRYLMVDLDYEGQPSGTYLYDVRTGKVSYWVDGYGQAWSPDGRKVILTMMKNREGCLIEYTLATKEANELYCPPKVDYFIDSHMSIWPTSADYSPDGKEIVFDAARYYGGEVRLDYGVYKLDIITKKIELLTASVIDYTYVSDSRWQPNCISCK
jgi:WD40 repeat protein